MARSFGLVVLGEDLQPRGRGFESWRQKLAGIEAKLDITLNNDLKLAK